MTSFISFFTLKIQEIEFWKVCLCFIACLLLTAYVKKLLNYVLKLLKLIWKGICSFFRTIFKSSRKKCSEVQCPFCGKSLDHCVCSKNQDRTYRERYTAYTRWKKKHSAAKKKK